MLSPEVWNFEPPPSVISSNICESEDEIFHRLCHQYFNHHVSVTLPNTVKIPNDIINTVLEDSQYYKINGVRAAEFLKQEFLDIFIKKGQLTAISLQEFSEQNSLMVIPCGRLILSLSQSNFQELGIEDTFQENSKSSLRRYFLNLDLMSDSNESKKKCEQAWKKLSLYDNLFFDIVLIWQPEAQDVCPSSIAFYFSKKGYFVKTCDVQYEQKLKYNMAVPVCDDESDIEDFIEWLGAFTLDCDMSSDNFISTLNCPEKNLLLGQVLHISFTGLFTQDRLQKLIHQIKKAKLSDMWASLSIQSFQNSILTVKGKQLFFSKGDQQCTIIFKGNHSFIIHIFQDKT